MSSETAIRVDGIGKSYSIYANPSDRLTQGLYNFGARWLRGALANRLRRRAQNVAHVHHAVADVTFSVRRGEAVGIIGRNGSGKSTILHMIAGTLAPSAGTLQVTGRVAALLELGSGFNPDFSGRENVFLNGQLLGLTRREIVERLPSIEAFAEIGSFFDEPVRTYSSGMFVRLAFAVIAHVDADILIIDEALAVGDAAFNQKCMRFLRDFMTRGTLLFVSHDLGSVKNLCDRAIWLERGRLRLDAPAKETADAYLRALFESTQGESIQRTPPVAPRSTAAGDGRMAVINASEKRNDLYIHRFDPLDPGFGRGGATIRHVAFVAESGSALGHIVGGERVRLVATIETAEALDSPIVGFFVRDRLGQELFGDNTCLTTAMEPAYIGRHETFHCTFEFDMPRLPRGQYSIVVAVANGTQDNHVQHHWLNEAILFDSQTSSVAQGLVGIPMASIAIMKSAQDVAQDVA